MLKLPLLTPSSVLDDDEVPTTAMWRGCLEGYSVPLMGKRGESSLPATGGSSDDRGLEAREGLGCSRNSPNSRDSDSGGLGLAKTLHFSQAPK